jgi:hypothetical protein
MFSAVAAILCPGRNYLDAGHTTSGRRSVVSNNRFQTVFVHPHGP